MELPLQWILNYCAPPQQLSFHFSICYVFDSHYFFKDKKIEERWNGDFEKKENKKLKTEDENKVWNIWDFKEGNGGENMCHFHFSTFKNIWEKSSENFAGGVNGVNSEIKRKEDFRFAYKD